MITNINEFASKFPQNVLDSETLNIVLIKIFKILYGKYWKLQMQDLEDYYDNITCIFEDEPTGTPKTHENNYNKLITQLKEYLPDIEKRISGYSTWDCCQWIIDFKMKPTIQPGFKSE